MEGPIVVGTDGSDTATVAVQEAIALTKAFALPSHVVSWYKPVSSNLRDLPPEFAGSLQPDSAVQNVLDDASARARQAGVDVEVHAETGAPAETIIELAEKV